MDVDYTILFPPRLRPTFFLDERHHCLQRVYMVETLIFHSQRAVSSHLCSTPSVAGHASVKSNFARLSIIVLMMNVLQIPWRILPQYHASQHRTLDCIRARIQARRREPYALGSYFGLRSDFRSQWFFQRHLVDSHETGVWFVRTADVHFSRTTTFRSLSR